MGAQGVHRALSAQYSSWPLRSRPGNPAYSLAFGAVGGILLSGLVLAGRATHVALFDHEYYKIQSRKRYFEKQLLFHKEQEETAQAHYVAALSAEYNPVATR